MRKAVKRVCLIVSLTLVMLVSGCGHQHIWTEATCTEPKTCSECGETEGEALGHKWIDATCEKAKYCEVCGETQGDPLEHKWIDATYTTPQTCSLCGITEGSPLPEPYCEKNNITFSPLEDMDIPFEMALIQDGKRAEINGVWFEKDPTAHYTFGEITSSPSETPGYVDITIPYNVTLSANVYGDASIYHGDAIYWNFLLSSPLIGDYYTGISAPSPFLDRNNPVKHAEFEWNDDKYAISYSVVINENHSNTGWQPAYGTVFTLRASLTSDFVYTITVPENYDGAVLYIAKTEPDYEDISEEENDKETYLLDEDQIDDLIFYRLSEIIDK